MLPNLKIEMVAYVACWCCLILGHSHSESETRDVGAPGGRREPARLGGPLKGVDEKMPIFGNAVAPRLTRASLAGPHGTKGGPRGACNAPELGHAVLVDQPSCRALTQPAEPRASNTGGSVRRLSTRWRGELARSPGMSRPPAVMMPSIGRTCGRPSCSSAPVCRIGTGGRGRRQ